MLDPNTGLTRSWVICIGKGLTDFTVLESQRHGADTAGGHVLLWAWWMSNVSLTHRLILQRPSSFEHRVFLEAKALCVTRLASEMHECSVDRRDQRGDFSFFG